MASSDPNINPLIGLALHGRYELQEQLGGGGMGAVYLAHDKEADQTVALKLVTTPQNAGVSVLQKRMLREIKVLMRADDPRVIALLDWGRDPIHGLFYTMEHLAGAVSLTDHIAARPPSFWECIRLLREVLCGLHALHEIKAIHRDIKPANILCVGAQEAPEIKLIDPGIAKWFPDDLRTQVTVETEAGGFVGTPPYTAPEMWQGIELDARTDLYQCGIMGYELLTGELPFHGTVYHVMFKHIQEPMPSLVPRAHHRWPSLAPELLNAADACIKRATAKAPEDRYPTARAFIEALDVLLDAKERPSTLALGALAPTQAPSEDQGRADTLDAPPDFTAPYGDLPAAPPLPTASSLLQEGPELPEAPAAPPPRPSVMLWVFLIVASLGGCGWLVWYVLTPPAPAVTRRPPVTARPGAPEDHRPSPTKAPGPDAPTPAPQTTRHEPLRAPDQRPKAPDRATQTPTSPPRSP